MNFKKLNGWFSTSTMGAVLAALPPLFIALAVNVLILIIPPPVQVTRSLFNFRLDVAFLLIIFLGLVLSRKGMTWDTVSLTLTLILFSIPLIYKWQTAEFSGSALGGFLPWSDARDYYFGAQHLLFEGNLTTWATRRPIFGGFLAVILSITGDNLQVTLAILAMLNGLAVFFASREIQNKHGSLVATTFLVICYWYYCAHAGFTASEQLGLCFGSLGITFLVRGEENGSLKDAAFGLFLLTIALNARAGAFFILPAIALWFGIFFRNKPGWWKPIAVGVVVIIIGIAGNFIMVKSIGPPDAVPFSNYSYTLYGLASGNKGWLQVMEDHPGVKEEEVFGLAIRKIREDPSLFLVGIIRSYQDYFTKTRGAFSFLNLVNDWKSLGGRLLWMLTWVGLAFALFTRKQRHYGLILAAFLGILLSVGLVPPVDANSMRIYAATMPFTIYMATIGISSLEQPFRNKGLLSPIPKNQWSNQNLLLSVCIILLLLCFIGPLIVKASSPVWDTGLSLSCPPGKEEMAFITADGSSLQLLDDQKIKESYLPNIRLTDFRNGTEMGTGTTLYPYLTKELLNIESGHTVSTGLYQKMDPPTLTYGGYLVTNGESIKPGYHRICVAPSPDEQLKHFLFYYEPEGKETGGLDLSIFHQNPALTARIRNLYGLGILLIYVFASLSFFRGWSTPPDKRIFLLEGSILIFVGVLIYLHDNALYILTWEQVPLNVEDATHRGGYSYEIPLGIDWMDRRDLGESPAVIYEDGVPLKYPNTPPFSVDRRGKGRFTIEGGNLILSSSDNSDPRNNGRHYEIYWPTPINQLFQIVCYILTAIFLILLYSNRINQVKRY